MNDNQFFKERTEANVFVQVVQRYLPFWPLFVITIAMSMAVAYIYLRSQQRIYVAYGKVLLKDPNRNGSDSKVLDALNIFGEKKNVENEIVVLKSSSLMQEVVRRLDLYASIFNEGRVRVEELYRDDSPVWFKAVNSDSINGGGRHSFSVDWKKKEIELNKEKIPFNSTVSIANTNYQVIPNPNYNQNLAGKNYYVIFNSIEGAASGLIGDLTASPISTSSSVIDVKLKTPVPPKGEDVLNTLFDVYNEAAINDKNQTAAKTLAFIDDRLRGVTFQLDSVEKGVQDYKFSNSIYNLSTQSQNYLENVSQFDKKKSEIEIQLDVLGSINNYINNKGQDPGTVPSLMLVNDPSLAALLQKLYEAEAYLQKNRSIAGEKSDGVIMALDQVSRLKSDIRENVATIRNNLVTAKSSINSRINLNSGMLKTIPQKERGLIDISRQQAIKNSIYTFLLQKREETALNSASTIADLRVIEKANASGPISPIPKNYYLTGLLIGVLIAAAFVMVREQLNRKVLFRQEIELKTSVPVVAEVAQVQKTGAVVISEGKRSAVAEQFRSMRTNLTFMGVVDKNNTILVTSSISGEGKSFTAINLAISFTLTGKKVALLELDLRRPKISNLLNIKRDPGISNYLVNQASFDEVIKPTTIKDLYVIPSGPVPPNPSELMIKPKFRQFMSEVKERFDYIIIDTAPIGPVTDAFLLKDFADATIFVVRHDATPKVYLKLIDDLSKQRKFKNMCLVFNGLKRRGFSSSSYGYGSAYGYGYSYAYGGENSYLDENGNGNGQVNGSAKDWKKRLKNTLWMK